MISWCSAFPDLPLTPSPKNVYWLADKLGIRELKDIAFEGMSLSNSVWSPFKGRRSGQDQWPIRTLRTRLHL